MGIKEDKISKLLAKNLLGLTSQEERRAIEEWKNESSKNEEIYSRLAKKEFLHEISFEDSVIDLNAEYAELVTKIKRKRYRRGVNVFLRIAASVLVVAGFVSLFNVVKRPQRTIVKVVDERPKNDIRLHLADGENISLSEELDTNILRKENICIGRDSVIKFKKENKTEDPEINKIEVPKGGEYRFYLSDGTQVFLNSETVIEFPKTFNGNTRTVKLKGEAYFNVVKDRTKPFIVKTSSLDIEVTGTQFNVKDYPEDMKIQATLVEGGIDVFYGNSRKNKVSIKPNQQAELVKGDKSVIVRQVDTKVFTAWLDNEFYFDKLTIKEIMESLSRWYDIEVFYQNEDVKDVRYSGKFKRYNNIDKVIGFLNKTENFKTEKNKNVVIVKEK